MKYDKNYFINSKISNYTDYDAVNYHQLAKDIFAIIGTSSVFDYGCGTGKLLNELNMLGLERIKGYDISEWAIQHGNTIYPSLKGKISNDKPIDLFGYEVIICLDVLEHLSINELRKTIKLFRDAEAKAVIVRMPVAISPGNDYILQVSRRDKTHVQKLTKEEWIALFSEMGFKEFYPVKGKKIYDGWGVLACLMM